MNRPDLTPTRTEVILGLIYLVFQQFILPLTVYLWMPLLPNQSAAVYNFILLAINFTATTILFRKLISRDVVRALENPFLCLRTAGIGFVANYLLTLGISILVSVISPDFVNVNDQTVENMIGTNYALMAVSVAVLAPVSEELLFRGLLFGALHSRSRFAAYLVSTVIFSLMHVIGYIFHYDVLTLALCFLQYLPASLCLAWAYERSGSIVTPILIHIAVNQLSLQFMR